MKLLNFIFLFAVLCLTQVLAKFEPYKVLGIHRRATNQEIKKAYKQMAKEWHPDKNKSPDAESRFIEITKAYELLSDPDRRRQYDNHGITEDQPNFRKQHDYAQYGRFDSDPFDSFFNDFFQGHGGGGFRFARSSGGGGGGGGDHKIFHKQSITSKAYWNTVLPNSSKQPYLILFYSDWCFTCLRIEPIWSRLVDELEPVGFGVATVHTEHERELTRKIGAKELPHMVLLLDQQVIHYKDPQFSALKVLEFIRRKFPYKMVEGIDDSNVDDFLNGWPDNRIRVLLFGHIDIGRLRYLTTAYRFRYRAAFGYIRIDDPKAANVVKRFGISTSKNSNKMDTILVFHEDPTSPVATASGKDLPLNTITDMIEANKFLQLPRLSNQEVFNALCPEETSRLRKRLCVSLIASNPGANHLGDERHISTLRDFTYEFQHDRIRYTYILNEKQSDFVKSLLTSKSSSASEGTNEEENNEVIDPVWRIVVLWRRDGNKVSFEWLKRSWAAKDEDSLNATKSELKTVLKKLLSPNEVLPYEAELKDLIDEHAQSIFVRIANKMIAFVENVREHVTRDELLPAVSLVVTVGFILIGGYVMNYLVKMEEESVQRQLGAKGMKVDKKGKVVPELKIHELRAETYNGMVRLIKPGCRTIVLIVDRESKEKLVPKFYKLAWPYRRNKTLMFGFIYIEKGLSWYKKILNLTLPEPREININPKNCIGTVLSLNGHRRYFCMYHAKHPEGSRKRLYTANNGSVAGAFMGMDSEYEDDLSDNEMDVERQNAGAVGGGAGSQPQIRNRKKIGGGIFSSDASAQSSPDHLPIFEDQLLDGLQIWLDRLFEGSTYRYHINYWPEFPISPASFSTQSTD